MMTSVFLAAAFAGACVTNADVFVNRPDCVVYVPQQPDKKELRDPAKRGDTYNDHFQVIWDEKRRTLFAFWTQASAEGASDQHIAFSKSTDLGRTWTEAEILAGSPSMKHPSVRASWQQPMLTKSGRLYCLYDYEITLQGPHCGEMYGIWSDDGGETWSRPGRVAWPRADCDGTDPTKPPTWCNWQKPLRLGSDGKYLVACSHFGKTDYDRMQERTDFLLFDNIDENPPVDKIRLKRLAANRKALTLADSNIEEGALVKLPDGRLFVLCRTWKGSPYWSQSRDGGETWDEPRPLRARDGRRFLHCCSPCPIYDWKGCEAGSGKYFALIHDSYDHRADPRKYQQRGPLYLIAGTFDPTGEQPISFGEPKLFIPRQYWCNACYSSYTVVDGKGILWFPDMKKYLLGKIIGPDWFEEAERVDERELGVVLNGPRIAGCAMLGDESAKDVTVRAKIRIDPHQGPKNENAGVAVVQDEKNFWELRLFYSPKQGRRFLLHETREGVVNAETRDGLPNGWGIDNLGWDFGVTYDVSLEVNDHGAIARIIDGGSTNVFRKFYRFDGKPGVKGGRPALIRSGWRAAHFSDVRLDRREPAPRKGPDAFTAWLAYGGRKHAFRNGLPDKDWPVAGTWVECVREKALPLSGEKVTFRIHGLPDDGKFATGGSEVSRMGVDAVVPNADLVHTALPTNLRRVGLWQRDANGGIPIETFAGRVHAGGGLRYVFPVGCNPNTKWQSPRKLHTSYVYRGGGVWESGYIVAKEGPMPDEAYAALWAGRPAAVALGHVKTYALFGEGEKPTVRLSAVWLGRKRGRNEVEKSVVKVGCIVRDWDGKEIYGWSEEKAMSPGERLAKEIVVEAKCPRGIYFVEATVADAATGEELAFARTNLAQLPPHRFATTPETSLMGLAAYWPIPDEESVQTLMDRMGVVRVREGDTRRQHAPRVANHHSQVPDDGRFKDEKEKLAWIENQLAACRENGNAYWEFGNELNMSTLGIALAGGGIGKALEAPRYAAWVRRVDRVRREKGYGDVQLLSMGMAGFDAAFFNAIYDQKVDGSLAGLCLHPGRGNFTPDYPFVRPERRTGAGCDGEGGAVKTDDPAKAERLSNSNFWNYYGAVRGLRDLSEKRGRKPLWLTEVYTPTYPNSFWEDTLRDSADNVVLTYALAVAEGVTCAFYYQLFDGVWYDRCGINTKDREYFFGLMNRDLSPKPAFMAYCAIAEALEGATFEGWAKLANGKQHGLLFKGGKMGRFAVLWDRSEGYVLTKSERPYKSPDPWRMRWKYRSHLELKSEKPVTVLDSIGRRHVLQPRDGIVRIPVGTSPTIVLCGDNPGIALYCTRK